MDYELALELKNAGFKQSGDNFDLDMPANIKGCYVPSLEELIEACGEKFYDLTKESGFWFSSSTDGFEIGDSTPSEAVARLWIALQAKESNR